MNTLKRGGAVNAEDLIRERFKALNEEGQDVLRRMGWDGSGYLSYPASDDYARFRTEALNLVRRACGEDSDHYRELRRLAEAKHSADNSFYFAHCCGVLEAAERDFQAGLLFDVRRLVSAEVLGDFIEQAEALLEAGYGVAAASLAGAVLEDTMRRLCDKHHVPIPEKTKIDSLNSALAKSGAYDKLVQKRITAVADLRNNADHGRFDKVVLEDVEDMVKWIRRFAADQLS